MDDETQYTQLDVLCLKALEVALSTSKLMDEMMPGTFVDTYRMLMLESISIIMEKTFTPREEVIVCIDKWLKATSPKTDPNATTAV